MAIKLPGNAPVFPVVILITGGYLAWFGIHYFKSDITWPTTPVKDVLTGKGVTPVTKNQEQSNLQSLQNLVTTLTTPGTTPGVNAGSPTPSGPGTNPLDPGSFASGVLDHSALMNLWTSSGGNPATANVAAAIAQAESSGRVTVTSSNPDGGTNVGLWQLDTKGKGSGYTVAQLQDPTTNARVAIMGSANGTNWSAWETFVTGAYKKFLVNIITPTPR